MQFSKQRTARHLSGGFFILVLLLAGCAAPPQSQHLLDMPVAQQPPPVELKQVPFFPQEIHQCGPAALATVLDWSGAHTTPEALTPQVYLPEREGSLQVELVAAARRHGRVPYRLRPQLSDLLAEVEAGYPVLVLQNLAFSWYPRWHYAVVVGFNLAQNRIVLRSGTVKRHVTTLQVFERTWARSGHWAIVVLPPGVLPAHARELPYLQAVVGFEQLGEWQAALVSYQAALARWPASLGAGMGVGNAHYALGQRAAAARAYRQVLVQHPDYAPALNNLAQTLADLGHYREALGYAQRAVARGGEHEADYRATLNAIERQLARPPVGQGAH